MAGKIKKIPIGILNRRVYQQFLDRDIMMNGGMCLLEVKKKRLKGLKGAIERYAEANMHINLEWILEYNGLLTELGVKENIFKL